MLSERSVWLWVILMLAAGCGDAADPAQDVSGGPTNNFDDPGDTPNPLVCGNGVCQVGESVESCPEDCERLSPEPNNAPNNDPSNNLNPGAGGFILEGKVLTPQGVLDPGQVLVVEDTIVCVAEDCTVEPEALDAALVITQGIISPGLIDAHNHLPYNFLPEWIPTEDFTNRYQWADDPSYEAHIRPFTKKRSSNSHFCPSARWAELRALIHGTTTILGQSFDRTCTQGWVRNADHSHGLQYDHMRTTIGSVRDINDEDARDYLSSFEQGVEPVTRFAVHMAEGVSDDNVDREFDSFAGRDPRQNRHNGMSLLNDTSILIHSVAVTDAHLVEAAEADAKIVWSPSSNLVLYGETADIGRILELGITTGISPDWTISGEDNMLAELRFARQYAEESGIAEVTPERLWRMATGDGAEVVGLAGFIGRLEPGQRADIVVFTDRGGDPYVSLINNRAADVRLVIIDGQAYYGDVAFEGFARHDECEPFNACGTAKFFCVRQPDQVNDWSEEGVEEIRGQLFEILEGIPGAPSDEQYGRGEELLDLVDCSE